MSDLSCRQQLIFHCEKNLPTLGYLGELIGDPTESLLVPLPLVPVEDAK
jgi:hypothetical protein